MHPQTQQTVNPTTMPPQISITSSHAIPNLSARPPSTTKYCYSTGWRTIFFIQLQPQRRCDYRWKFGSSCFSLKWRNHLLRQPSSRYGSYRGWTDITTCNNTFLRFQHRTVPPRTTVNVNDLAQLLSAAKKTIFLS